MHLSNIIARISKPMYVTEQGLSAIHVVVRNHLLNRKAEIEDLFDDMEEPEPYDLMPGVRVIPVHGYIGYRVSALQKSCGVCDIGELADRVEAAANDESVQTIVLDINSGGGEITYVQECAERIMEVGKTKTVIGFTDTMACSSAQWIMAACNETYATPSADLGSIGVRCTLFDTSKLYEREGVQVKLYTSGKLKGLGHEGLPITEEQDAYMKSEIVKLGNQFKSYMKSRMPNLKDEDMEGQTLSGQYMYDNENITGLVYKVEDIFE